MRNRIQPESKSASESEHGINNIKINKTHPYKENKNYRITDNLSLNITD